MNEKPNTTETVTLTAPPNEKGLNFWASLDLLCQAAEAASFKGGIFTLEDNALLYDAVKIVKGTLAQVRAKGTDAQEPVTEQDVPEQAK